MNIEIRKAQAEEFKEIHQLILEFATFQKTPERVKITPEQMVQDQTFFNCLIARKENKIIGFATYFFSYYSWTGKAIYLDDLYVQSDQRGLGIGNQLFEAIADLGKKENCTKMKWQVSKWNTPAQEFYKSKGANIDDTEINCELGL